MLSFGVKQLWFCPFRIKALFKALSKGKVRDLSSNTDMVVADAIMNSKSIIVACAAGQGKGFKDTNSLDSLMKPFIIDSHPADAMRLFNLVKLASGVRTHPQKNVADLSKSLTQVRNEIKTLRERIMQQSIPDKSELS